MTFFYNLNKTLDAIREKPELKHGQLNERDMGKHNNATTGFDALAKKAGKEYGSKAAGERVAGAVKAKMAKAGKLEEQGMEEGIVGDMARKAGSVAKKVGGAVLNKLGHGDDAEMMRDLQKKMGVPQTGEKPQQQVKEKMNPAKAKSFAALAEPKDKITFADKIAGAKKEVDEMLGDVAAEAMKAALTPKQKKLDRNNNGKIDGQDLAMLRKGGKKQVADEGFPTVAGARAEMNKRKVGDVTHGAKHDTQEIPGGRRVTRRVDDKGYSVGSETDDEGNAKSTEKRGRGRPKKADKAPERVTAKATKHKGGRKTNEGEGEGEGNDMVKLAKVIASCTTQAQLDSARRMAQNFLKKHQTGDLAFYGDDMKRGMAVSKDIAKKRDEIGGEELEEKAVSKKQQKFMGMVHATQKGEKAPSKEVAKVAKEMPKKAAKDFASTKQKGLPEKAPKKKEKTEEAGGTDTPTASSGFSYGKGIYDSMNRDLENMIKESMSRLDESMSINVSSSTEGGKNITVTASEEDAVKLADILKNAGLGGGEGYGGSGYQSSCDCGTPDCGCGDEEIDENQPDWPTNTETLDADSNLRTYSGGLNGPKSTGQTTEPVIAGQDDRMHTYAEAEEDAIKRMMEMAGVTEAKKPDFLDVDKDGDKKEPFKKAVDDKKEKQVDEGILSATANLWSEYKGKYGV